MMASMLSRAPLVVLLTMASVVAANIFAPDGDRDTLGGDLSEGLKQQTLRALQEKGESITIMVCGESGMGNERYEGHDALVERRL